MNALHSLLRWLIRGTITDYERTIETLKEDNYRLRRRVQQLQKDKGATPHPEWSLADWDEAYGKNKI